MTCAVRGDGSLWCWGSSIAQQLGVPDDCCSAEPIELAGDWAQVAVGEGNVCAIDAAGALVCWGWNPYDILGAELGAWSTFQPVPIDGSWRSIAIGPRNLCGVQLDGTLWCWGANGAGQLGQGDADGSSHAAPEQVPGGPWWSVAVGEETVCGVDLDDRVACWGSGSDGALGDGSDGRATPGPITRSW